MDKYEREYLNSLADAEPPYEELFEEPEGEEEEHECGRCPRLLAGRCKGYPCPDWY